MKTSTQSRRGWNLRKDMPRTWQPYGVAHAGWKGELASKTAKRKRARRMYSLGSCQDCGAEATDRHHIDDNTGNNAPENIAILCRRCHMKRDGRLAALAACSLNRKGLSLKDPEPCVNCGTPAKPLRRGLCHACNEYQRRNGSPRPYTNQTYKQVVAARKSEPCKRCGRPSNIKGNPTKGFCTSCYRYMLGKKNGGAIKPFRG